MQLLQYADDACLISEGPERTMHLLQYEMIPASSVPERTMHFLQYNDTASSVRT